MTKFLFFSRVLYRIYGREENKRICSISEFGMNIHGTWSPEWATRKGFNQADEIQFVISSFPSNLIPREFLVLYVGKDSIFRIRR